MAGQENSVGEEKLLGMIGLCRRSGRLVAGVPMICEHLAKKPSPKEEELLVIEASDSSDNTHKRITDKCAYYKVEHIRIASGCLALGAAVGKSATAAVLVTGRDMCRAVRERAKNT